MGVETFGNIGKLVMINKNGNETELNGVIKELTVEPEVIERDDTLFDDRVTKVTNYSGKCSFEVKSITRKRFIKLLMARGIARNGAKDIAEYVCKKYGNYNSMFLMML